jgi:hypothetical protein
MNLFSVSLRNTAVLASAVCLAALLAGCATKTIDWAPRVGSYTFDQAVIEIGPPDKQAKLQDGTVVAEWLTYRGHSHTYIAPDYYGPHGRYYGPMFPAVVDSNSPDCFLRLTFDPSGKLKDWKKITR